MATATMHNKAPIPALDDVGTYINKPVKTVCKKKKKKKKEERKT